MNMQIDQKENWQKNLNVFSEIFSEKPQCISFAPGRVNLIGEHTDYTGGMVFPFAIHEGISLIASHREDRKIHIHDIGFQIDYECNLSDNVKPHQKMKNFVEAIRYTDRFLQENHQKQFHGANILIDNTLPLGGGVSSSAAMFVAITQLIFSMVKQEYSQSFLYEFAQKLEHEVAGVPCGIMDQMASVLGKENHLILIHCDSNDYQLIPWNFDEVECILFDSGIRHELQNSAYAGLTKKAKEILIFLKEYQSNTSCQTFEWKNIAHTLSQNITYFSRFIDFLSHKISHNEFEEYQRIAKHIIFENNRVFQTAQAMATSDLSLIGKMLNQSHQSLKNDYQVSHQVCDFLAETLSKSTGVYGSRIVGAGFGGNVLALIQKEHKEHIINAIRDSFQNMYRRDISMRIVKPSDGARFSRSIFF